MLLQIIFYRSGGLQCGGAEQIVAAAVTVTPRIDRARLRHARLLAQTRQRIVFTQQGNNGFPGTIFAQRGGWHSGNTGCQAKTFLPEHGFMQRRRTDFFIVEFRYIPDAVAKCGELRIFRGNQFAQGANDMGIYGGQGVLL